MQFLQELSVMYFTCTAAAGYIESMFWLNENSCSCFRIVVNFWSLTNLLWPL